MKENALTYHKELVELERLISRIENSIDWVDAAINHVEDPSSVIAISLSFAEGDLQESLQRFKQQQYKIVQILSNFYL